MTEKITRWIIDSERIDRDMVTACVRVQFLLKDGKAAGDFSIGDGVPGYSFQQYSYSVEDGIAHVKYLGES